MAARREAGKGPRCARGFGAAAVAAIGFTVMACARAAVVAGTVDPAPPPDDGPSGSAAGHGSISIAYLDTLAEGLRIDPHTTLPSGTVRSRGARLDLDYQFTDHWSAQVGIPFLSNRYSGIAPHCPTRAPPQCAQAPALDPSHPESQFLDDGGDHATWQDWTFGATYQTRLGSYFITPGIALSVPSHDYTFFANAAVGQRIWQLELSATLAHQFDFSNWYYRLGYGYVFAEKVLDTRVNHHRFDLELGYFINEKVAARMFATGRAGHGYAAGDLLPRTAGQTNAYWYHHDQISEHNYAGVGAGVDYGFGAHWTWSTSVQRLVWGQTVFDFKYALESRLSRAF